MGVQVPGQALKSTGDDLAQPVVDLLEALHLETEADPREPLAMVKADAMALTKWVAGLVGAGGALSSALAAFAAWNTSPGHEGLKVAIVAAVAVIVSVTIAVVGWVTTTDVRARADLQQARYAARGRLVTGWLEMVDRADFTKPGAPAGPGVEINLGDGLGASRGR